MKEISQKGIDLIKRFEGYSSCPYKCAGGCLTIGYGHVIRDNEKFTKVTEKQAEDILRNDLCAAEETIKRLVHVPLSTNQFDALVSLVFNIGSGNFSRSTLLKRINKKEYDSVPEEIMKWIYANKKPLEGLKKRRKAEAELFSGEVEESSTQYNIKLKDQKGIKKYKKIILALYHYLVQLVQSLLKK